MFNIQIRNRHAHSRRDKIVSKHTYSRKKMVFKKFVSKSILCAMANWKTRFFYSI